MQFSMNLFQIVEIIANLSLWTCWILEDQTLNWINFSSSLHRLWLMVCLKYEGPQTLDHRSLIDCPLAMRPWAKNIPRRAWIFSLDVDQVSFFSLLRASVSVHDTISQIMKSSMNNVNADMILPSIIFFFAYEVCPGLDLRTFWEGICPVATSL